MESSSNQCSETSFHSRAPFRLFKRDGQQRRVINPGRGPVGVAALILQIASDLPLCAGTTRNMTN